MEVSGPAFGRLFKNLGFFSASPTRALRTVWGLIFRLPTFSPFLYICQNAQELLHFQVLPSIWTECFIFLDTEISSTKIPPETWSDRFTSDIEPCNLKLTTNSIYFLASVPFLSFSSAVASSVPSILGDWCGGMRGAVELS